MDVLGLTEIDGVITSNLAEVNAPNGRILIVKVSGSYRLYETSETQQNGGIQLSSGNYANPVYIDTSRNNAIYNEQNVTAYIIKPTDAGNTLRMLSGDANTVTIDTNSNQNYPVNMVCLIAQDGEGVTSLNSVAGVTVNGVSGDTFTFDFAKQYQAISIEQVSIDNWIVRGI